MTSLKSFSIFILPRKLCRLPAICNMDVSGTAKMPAQEYPYISLQDARARADSQIELPLEDAYQKSKLAFRNKHAKPMAAYYSNVSVRITLTPVEYTVYICDCVLNNTLYKLSRTDSFGTIYKCCTSCLYLDCWVPLLPLSGILESGEFSRIS